MGHYLQSAKDSHVLWMAVFCVPFCSLCMRRWGRAKGHLIHPLSHTDEERKKNRFSLFRVGVSPTRGSVSALHSLIHFERISHWREFPLQRPTWRTIRNNCVHLLQAPAAAALADRLRHRLAWILLWNYHRTSRTRSMRVRWVLNAQQNTKTNLIVVSIESMLKMKTASAISIKMRF